MFAWWLLPVSTSTTHTHVKLWLAVLWAAQQWMSLQSAEHHRCPELMHRPPQPLLLLIQGRLTAQTPPWALHRRVCDVIIPQQLLISLIMAHEIGSNDPDKTRQSTVYTAQFGSLPGSSSVIVMVVVLGVVRQFPTMLPGISLMDTWNTSSSSTRSSSSTVTVVHALRPERLFSRDRVFGTSKGTKSLFSE